MIILERDPKPAALIDLLELPLVLRDLVFLGEVEETASDVGPGQRGSVRGACCTWPSCSIALVTLLFRYNEVER